MGIRAGFWNYFYPVLGVLTPCHVPVRLSSMVHSQPTSRLLELHRWLSSLLYATLTVLVLALWLGSTFSILYLIFGALFLSIARALLATFAPPHLRRFL